MKTLITSILLLGAFSVYANNTNDFKIEFISCTLTEDNGSQRKVTLTKEKETYNDGMDVDLGYYIENGYRGIYSSRTGETLETEVRSNGFVLTGRSRHDWDTDGNIGIPDNRYTEQVEQLTYNSDTKEALHLSQDLKKPIWPWRDVIVESESENIYTNCTEHYTTLPNLDF